MYYVQLNGSGVPQGYMLRNGNPSKISKNKNSFRVKEAIIINMYERYILLLRLIY